jgi:hypothetical protein
MTKKPRLSLLLGAGASIHAGIPSTQKLTDLLEQLPLFLIRKYELMYPEFDKSIPLPDTERLQILRIVLEKLTATFQNQPNFEHILAALEDLESLAASLSDDPKADNFRLSVSPFVRIDDPRLTHRQALRIARHQALKAISREMLNVTNAKPALHQDMDTFMTRVRQDFDVCVFTLNYDDLVERGGGWFDGFTQAADDIDAKKHPTPILTFDRKEFVAKADHEPAVICHLHGSVLYGEHLFRIAKFASHAAALQTLDSMSSGQVVNGVNVTGDPIISGLNKIAKLAYSPIPYGYYYRHLMNSLLTCPRMLIVGYGGNDEHFNVWFEEFAKVHGNDLRVGYVTRRTGADMGPNSPTGALMRLFAGDREFQDELATYQDAAPPPRPEYSKHGHKLAVCASQFPPLDPNTVDLLMKHLLS